MQDVGGYCITRQFSFIYLKIFQNWGRGFNWTEPFHKKGLMYTHAPSICADEMQIVAQKNDSFLDLKVWLSKLRWNVQNTVRHWKHNERN